MNRITFRSAWLLPLSTVLCWELAIGQAGSDATANAQLVTATNRFGFALLRQLQQQDGDGNIIYSPLSVMLALGMAYNGANGTTEREMRRALGFERLSLEQINQSIAAMLEEFRRENAGVNLRIANSLWIREGVTFNPDFLDRNQSFYGAQIAALDFNDPASATMINDWAARSTNGKIPFIIDELESRHMLMLINAVYFRADWAFPFNPERTKTDVFHLSRGTTRQVAMMNSFPELDSYSGDGVLAVSLPYEAFGAQMELFLPARGGSIAGLLRKLSYDSYRRWKRSFESRRVTLKLPRVKLEYKTRLSAQLQALGMRVAFTDAADFSGMTSAAQVLISDLVHKATLDLDENGTEASAVTSIEAVAVSKGRLRQRPFEFIADRPFVVMITDRRSDAILFMGIVMNPQADMS